MMNFLKPMSAVSLLLTGGIFGFFYAWVCSTMWGLDGIDPRVAITAMNGMNDSVRNAVFAPAFFGTPIALLITAALARGAGAKGSARAFAAAGIVYVLGAFAVTIAINVPMNRALLGIDVPDSLEAAREIWEAYSGRWQVFNILRTLVSGVSLLLTGWAIYTLPRP